MADTRCLHNTPGISKFSQELRTSRVIRQSPVQEVLEFTRQSLSAIAFNSQKRCHPSSHLPRALSAPPGLSVKLIASEKNKQGERLLQRKQHLAYSRSAKNKSNIIPHRQDYGYYIAGSSMTLSHRYDIDDEELIRLRLLAQRRIGGSSRASSVNSSLVNYRHVTSNGVRPGFLSSVGETAKPLTPSAAQLATPLTPSAAQLATPLTPSAAQLAKPLTPSAAVLAEKRKNILERRQQLEDGRLRRKELRKKRKNAQKIRLEERMKFEKEMEERYRPKIPDKKSLIFLADQEDMKATVKERILLKYFTNDDDGEESVKPLVNDEQRAVFANIFDEIDLNRDGWIDMKEFKGKLCSMATKDQLKQLLQVFDVNRDSFVDKREFVVICALNDKLRGSRTESGTTSLELNIQRLANFLIIYKELFDIIDEDGDGKVQVDEVVLLVKTAVQADQSLCEEKIMMELGIMEKDEKGCIDFITFIYNVSLFSRLFRVVMDSPLSVSNLEDVRDRVLRKHSRKASGNT